MIGWCSTPAGVLERSDREAHPPPQVALEARRREGAAAQDLQARLQAREVSNFTNTPAVTSQTPFLPLT